MHPHQLLGSDSIPREERSYKEFFPDLLIDDPLSVQLISVSTILNPNGESDKGLVSEPLDVVHLNGGDNIVSLSAATGLKNGQIALLSHNDDRSEAIGLAIEDSNAADCENGNLDSLAVRLVSLHTQNLRNAGVTSCPASPRSGPTGNTSTNVEELTKRSRWKSSSETFSDILGGASMVYSVVGVDTPSSPEVSKLIPSKKTIDCDLGTIADPAIVLQQKGGCQKRASSNGDIKTNGISRRNTKNHRRKSPEKKRTTVSDPSLHPDTRLSNIPPPILVVPQPVFRRIINDSNDSLYIPITKPPVSLPVLPVVSISTLSAIDPSSDTQCVSSAHIVLPSIPNDNLSLSENASKPDTENSTDSADGIVADVLLLMSLTGDSANVSIDYIKYTDSNEHELEQQVEYDMDDRDKFWVDAIETQHKEAQKTEDEPAPSFPYDLFEFVIDRLEKEWFELTRDLQQKLQQKEQALLPDEGNCAICDDGECENTNAIVFCDGCNVAVHQECYGVPYIPEGQWLCRKCLVSPEKPVTCIFCPMRRGAYKQTTNNQWAHLLCAMWIPETSVANPVYMEPIDNVEKVPRTRWKLICYICRKKAGACIQCSNKSCYAAFHATCAQKAKLYMRNHGTRDMKAFCDRHAPPSYDVKYAIEQLRRELEEQTEVNGDDFPTASVEELEQGFWNLEESHVVLLKNKSSSSSRRRKVMSDTTSEHVQGLVSNRGNSNSDRQRTMTGPPKYHMDFNPLLPLVPHIILQKLIQRAAHFGVPAVEAYLPSICKYWALKRETRRGAPMLRRLHLEPWTATPDGAKATREQHRQKVEAVILIRKDLERLRILSELVRKREKEKARQLFLLRQYWETIFYPLKRLLQATLDAIVKHDRLGIFAEPVDPETVPDYLTYIQQPMDFSTISTKIDHMMYPTIRAFKDDLALIWRNCCTYNRQETIFYKAAQRLERHSDVLLQQLEQQVANLSTFGNTGILTADFDSHIWNIPLDDLDLTGALVSEDEETDPPTSNPASASITDNTNTAAEKTELLSSLPVSPILNVVSSVDETDMQTIGIPQSHVTLVDSEVKVEPIEEFNTEDASVTTRLRERPRQSKSAHRPTRSRKSVVREPLNKQIKKVNEEPEAPVYRPPTPMVERKHTRRSLPQIFVNDMSQDVLPGQLVWAKLPGFPWFPAQVVNPDVKGIPRNITDLATQPNSTSILVKFFDALKTWSWRPPELVVALGLNAESDAERLANRTDFVTSRQRAQAQDAYTEVMKLVGRDSEPVLTQVTEQLRIMGSPKKRGKINSKSIISRMNRRPSKSKTKSKNKAQQLASHASTIIVNRALQGSGSPLSRHLLPSSLSEHDERSESELSELSELSDLSSDSLHSGQREDGEDIDVDMGMSTDKGEHSDDTISKTNMVKRLRTTSSAVLPSKSKRRKLALRSSSPLQDVHQLSGDDLSGTEMSSLSEYVNA